MQQMTTGTEIVDEFHRNTFFYQSMADEWLAKRIDDAIRAAVESANAKIAENPVTYDWDRPLPETAPRMPKYVAPTSAKKPRARK